MPITSSFLFTTCNAGSEKSLKGDVLLRNAGRLTPAFMRPQLITWKSKGPLDGGFALGSIFARVSGLSMGMATTDDDVVGLAEPFKTVPVHLHVFPRVTDENGVPDDVWALIDARRERIAGLLKDGGIQLLEPGRPMVGDWVLDVIVDETEDKPLFVGAHRHAEFSHPLPGALPRIVLPENVPSRAWLKLEQALVWAGLDGPHMLKGKGALELGCSPGGATVSLLNRGVKVIGVDPGPMDESVQKLAEAKSLFFKHLQIPVGQLNDHPLPKEIDMIVCDMNLAPPVVLTYVENIQHRVNARLMILTLKLNDKMVEVMLPQMMAKLRSWAPHPLRAVQLAANRSEFCVVAGRL
jgi:23S rRNA (cytidine2498-2'-O)-methyltransferase